jgi:hypothetical protein
MRDYAKIAPQFWMGQTGKQIKKRGTRAQLIALHFISNPHSNMLGMYYLPIIFIAHETGIPFKNDILVLSSVILTTITLQNARINFFCSLFKLFCRTY